MGQRQADIAGEVEALDAILKHGAVLPEKAGRAGEIVKGERAEEAGEDETNAE
ncbi:MAG: hypothetical protein AMXMBFR20_03230 [Planctomycetia bacterium]